jgi:hypothetical protein
MHLALAVLIERLPCPMVVWVTLQRHPSVVATRVAGAVMPFRGIRPNIMLDNAQLTSHTFLGEHWRAAKKLAAAW